MRVSPTKFFKLSLIAALTAGLLAACSQSKPAPATADTAPPTLLAFLDAQTRTVTERSVLIMGAVSDEGGVKSLFYSLNGGARQDVTSSVSGEGFGFTVAGLLEGKNEVSVSAADAAGNEASAALFVEVVPPAAAFPAVEGVWTAAGVATSMCGQRSSSVTFVFDAPGESGSLAGLWQMVDDNGSGMTGPFAGTLSREGAFEGVATLSHGARPARFDLTLTVAGETVKGNLASQGDVTCWGEGQPASFGLTLERFEDDAFEANDRAEDAAALELDASQNLVLRGGDEDWFTFELPKAQIVTLGVGTSGSYYDAPTVELLDASLERLAGTEFYGEGTLSRGLEAGTYHLRVFSGSLKHYAYSLSLDTAALPDEAYEPNDTKAKATPITSGFAGDFYLTVGDEDWFSFTLAKEQVVTLYLGDTYGLRYAFDAAAGADAESYPGRPVARALKAGTHTLRVFTDSTSSRAYSLSLSVTALPDEALEPNNTFSTPAKIALPYAHDLFMSEGDEDWFTFTLTQEQLVTFYRTDDATSYSYGLRGVLYTDVGAEVKRFDLYAKNPRLALLPAGAYRLSLAASEGFAYSLAVSAETSNDASFEPNNTREGASAVTLDFANNKLLAGDGDTDWFTFTLAEGAQVEIKLTTAADVRATLYNENRELLDFLYGAGSVSPVLSPGTYYVEVESHWSLSKYGLSIAKK